jgi:S-DNA-T family DNA segregation ATPase FtsK/SpoIIIE
VVVDVPAGRQQPTLSWRRRGVVYRLGGADGLPVRLALEAARALGGRSAFPPRVELGDLLGLAGDAERHVLESWIRDRSTAGRPLAAVVGLGGGGRPLAVDLQAAGHLVIGGAPGSGKSELLRCLVASLAVRHAPSALALALIDPRGALGACADLPHVVGHVGGPGDGACRQALAWLEGELSRRGAVLRQAGCGSLEELQRAAPQRAPARLVVLVDQAEELLAHAPHAAPSLVEAARAGRRLGVHLVLATCQPGQVAAVPGPRVALRCDDEGTSEALVGSGEAGRGGLPAGRGLLCAAPGHLAEFQGAAAPDQRLRRLVDAVARVHERLSVRSGTAG